MADISAHYDKTSSTLLFKRLDVADIKVGGKAAGEESKSFMKRRLMYGGAVYEICQFKSGVADDDAFRYHPLYAVCEDACKTVGTKIDFLTQAMHAPNSRIRNLADSHLSLMSGLSPVPASLVAKARAHRPDASAIESPNALIEAAAPI